jgi:hypothetical protein
MGQLRTTNKRHKRAVTAAAKPMAPAPAAKAKPAAKKGK